MGKRQIGIDFARLMAAYLVLLGHFLVSGTFGVDDSVRQWIGLSEPMPLLDSKTYGAWRFDIYLLSHGHTACAIIGVGLFFLISGWLVPPMLRNYTRARFLENRVLRIFPMLIVAVLAAACLQYGFGNRATFSLPAVLSTLTLTTQFTGLPLLLGVVWTLIIECKFFLLLFAVGILTQRRILMTVLGLSAFNFFHELLAHFGCYALHPYVLSVMNAQVHDAHFLIFMLIPASLWIALQEQEKKAKVTGLLCVAMIAAAFNVNRWLLITHLQIHPIQDLNFLTQAIVAIIFGACVWVQSVGRFKEWIARSISAVAAITYSLYLLHVPFGFFLLSRLRHTIGNPYLLILVVILLVSCMAALAYRLIERPTHRYAQYLRRDKTPRVPL